MIPPRAPYFGELWESGVKPVKLHLKKILGNTLLSYEEFLTLVVQIEASLSSRLLSLMSSEPNDLQPLPPGHFLIETFPQSLAEAPSSRKILNEKRYQLGQRIRQQFWSR